MTPSSGGSATGSARDRRGRLAWVVVWEWSGDHARVDEPIAAILPRRLGHETVRLIVEALYANRSYTPAEMLEAARDRGHNPYRAVLGSCSVINEDGSPGTVTWQGEILCGHNPHLIARLARVLADGEAVRYEWAHDRPRIDLRGYRPDVSLEPPG